MVYDVEHGYTAAMNEIFIFFYCFINYIITPIAVIVIINAVKL